MESVVVNNQLAIEKVNTKVKILLWITISTLFILAINLIGTMLLLGGMLTIDGKIN